jgi:peptide chain release factor subunit 1
MSTMRANRPTLTTAEIRALATHHAEPVVTSVFLDVDGRSRPVADEYRAAFARLADTLRHRVHTLGDRRTARAVNADIDHMRAWLGRDLDRSATRGVALFSASEQDWFETVELPRPVRDDAGIAPAPRVAQLLAVLDEYEPVVAVLADRRRLRVLLVELGELAEIADVLEWEDRAVDTTVELGGYQRHTDDRTRGHFEGVARLVEHAIADHPSARLVVAGPDQAIAAVEDHLRPETRQRIVGRAGLSPAAGYREIHDAIATIARAAERRHEAEVVEQLRQAATRSERRGVVGLEATLAALADKRVDTLVVSEGFSAPGARCPACGRTGIGLRQCPSCGATAAEFDDIVEDAIGQALAQRATVEFARGTELDRYGRIGVLTRY